MTESIDELLDECIKEFKDRLRNNSDLKINESGNMHNVPENLKKSNIFETNKYIVMQLRDAYESRDIEKIKEVPIDDGDKQINSISYNHNLTLKRIETFYGESLTQQFKHMPYFFKAINNSGKPVRFYQYLNELIESFKEKRDNIMKDIYESEDFKKAENECQDGKFKDHRHIKVKTAYWKEELKRKTEIIGICDKAIEIYDFAHRLLEGITKNQHP